MKMKMKKLFLTALLSTFIVSPVFANDFVIEQVNMLTEIATKMENAQGDTASIDYLGKKKSCIEAATNMGELKDCVVKYPAAKLKDLGTAAN
jgi:outer membrane lipoprotein-sorting protein